MCDEYTCLNCGVIFPREAPRYCSKTCSNEGRQARPETHFWPLVDKDGPLPLHQPELGPCWLWMGSRQLHGYGMTRLRLPGQGAAHYNLAHRVAWTLDGRQLPSPPLMLRHRCDRRACVRPSHLLPGTAAQNMDDAVVRQRIARGARHGRTPFTDEDVLAIRAQYAGGTRIRPLARQWGCDRKAISLIVNRKTWKHLR